MGHRGAPRLLFLALLFRRKPKTQAEGTSCCVGPWPCVRTPAAIGQASWGNSPDAKAESVNPERGASPGGAAAVATIRALVVGLFVLPVAAVVAKLCPKAVSQTQRGLLPSSHTTHFLARDSPLFYSSQKLHFVCMTPTGVGTGLQSLVGLSGPVVRFYLAHVHSFLCRAFIPIRDRIPKCPSPARYENPGNVPRSQGF